MMKTHASSGSFQRKFARAALSICLAAGAALAGEYCAAQVARPAAPAAKAPAAAAAAASKVPAKRAVAPANTTQMRVMAVVNSEQVTRQELATECLRRYGSEVLESMINKHVIAEACATAGIEITDRDINDEITRLAKKFGVAPDVWLDMLERERGITQREYRDEIVWPSLALRQLAANKLAVTDEDLQRSWEHEFGAQVKARIIATVDKKKAVEILKMAKADPDNFGELAKNVSEDVNSASAHGLIPPIRRHGDPQFIEIENTAFSLKEGEISPILQVANQYIIIKCEQHLPQVFVPPDKMEDARQRLLDKLHDDKLRTASADLFKKLQDDAQVVNVYNDLQLRKQYPGVAAAINEQQITNAQLAEECIRRHGIDVLEGEINRKILMQALARRKKEVTEELIDAEIERAAIAYGFVDKKTGAADLEAWQKSIEDSDGASVDLYVRDAVWPSVALKLLVGESIEVAEEELEKGFLANYGERVEVQAIVVSSNRQAQQVWEQARGNPSKEFFSDLAEQYSIDPVSRGNGGLVPPIRMHGGQPKIEAEAFKLKPGGLSTILALEDKFIIMRCIGRTRPIVKDFEAVKDELYQDIHEKKLRLAMAKEFETLRDAAQVDNFLAGTTQEGKSLTVGPSLRTDASVKPASGTKAVAVPRAGTIAPR